MNDKAFSTEPGPDAEMRSRLSLGKPGSKRRRRFIWIGLALVAVAGIGFAMFAGRKPVEYVTQSVTRGPMAITVTATGTLAPRDSVDVGAEVSGKIDAMYVDFNDHVKKGEVLARINTDQIQAQLDQARATLAQAQATVEQDKATFNRYQALIKTNAISPQTMEQAKADYDRALAGVAMAQGQVQQDQTLLGKATIVAPIDGVVLDRKMSQGQTVTAGFTTPVLFTLASDLSQMELDVDIDEADVGLVKPGDAATFTVDAYPNKIFHAKLISVHNAAQTVQNVVTYKGVLLVQNQELLLKPGMTATATILADKIADALQVPNAALRFIAPDEISSAAPPLSGDPSAGRVWMESGKTIKPHDLRIGPTNGRSTEVLKGDLKPGDKVVTDTKSSTPGEQ